MQLFKWAIKHKVSKGDVIFEEGETNDGLYLLYLGKIDLIGLFPASEKSVYPGAAQL